MTSKYRIVILGSGNVSSHISVELNRCAYITQVYSHNIVNAKALATTISVSNYTDNTAEIQPDADIYLFMVKDDAIKALADKLHITNPEAIMIHTSGSVTAEVFADKATNYGVLYPLQSFTKGVEVDLTTVSLFIEGNNSYSHSTISELANTLSHRVYDADSTLRGKLHVAAVFACNFSNHMWCIAQELMGDANLPFEVLQPLIESSVSKLRVTTPDKAQTGPAIRNDKHILEQHQAMLNDDNRAIYKIISDNIYKKHNR